MGTFDLSISDVSGIANTIFVAITAGVYLWIGWITKKYALATEKILVATQKSADAARIAAFGSAWVWAAERLSDPGRVEKRRIVIEELPHYRGPLREMPKYMREAFDETCRTYDLIGIAGANGMLPLDVIAREWGDSIVKCHRACEPFLAEQRGDRGRMFWDNFTQLHEVARRVWDDPDSPPAAAAAPP